MRAYSGGHSALRHWVEDQVWYHFASVGIGDQRLGKVSGALESGGNCGYNRHRIVFKHSLHIHEEKCLVLADRPTQREPVLIARMIGPGKSGLIAEEIIGVEERPLAKPPCGSVIRVRAAFQRHVHDRAAIAAELCRKAVVLDFEFLHRFD